MRRSDRDFGLPRPLLPRNPLRTERAYSRLAKSVLPRPGTTAETYVAYGFTQKLFEACSAQADYRIPQASQKGAQVPKTPAGEDLGVGEGWWYEGSSFLVKCSGSKASKERLQTDSCDNHIRSRSSPNIFHLVTSHLPTHVSSNCSTACLAVPRKPPHVLPSSN